MKITQLANQQPGPGPGTGLGPGPGSGLEPGLGSGLGQGIELNLHIHQTLICHVTIFTICSFVQHIEQNKTLSFQQNLHLQRRRCHWQVANKKRHKTVYRPLLCCDLPRRTDALNFFV